MIQDRTYVIHKGKFLPSVSFCGFDDRGVPWVCYGEGGKEYPARRQDLVLLTPARHVDCVHDVVAVDGRIDPSVTDAAICRDPRYILVDLDGDGFTDEEKEYGRRSGTHLDFLLFTRLGRRPVLAIEVDGVAFHKADSVQGKRDRLKDAIMAKAGIPLLRASTDAAGLEETLNEYLGG